MKNVQLRTAHENIFINNFKRYRYGIIYVNAD